MDNPHDRFFRHVFSDPENAAGELKTILPAELSAHIAWSSLRLVPGSYVDAELSDLRSDVLFETNLDGRPLLIYFLLEHQSSFDRWMPLKMLGYMLRIWEDFHKKHLDTQLLPPIVPGVVYHGDRAWPPRMLFMDLLDVDQALHKLLAPHVPEFEFHVDDLSGAQAESLRARAMTAIAQLSLFCLSRARKSGDVAAELAQSWQDRMREVADAPNGVAALGTVLRYLLEASETPPERVRNLVRQLGPRAEEAFMTGAQILRAEGKAEGEAKGKAEGEAKGKADTLLKLLELKFGALPDSTTRNVRGATLEQLDSWIERIFQATSLEDVFAS